MSRPKAFVAERWRYEAQGHDFLITKGASKYSRYYLLDPESFKYLTSKGHSSLLDAQIEANTIARARNVAATVKAAGY